MLLEAFKYYSILDVSLLKLYFHFFFHGTYLMPGILLLVRAVLADDAGAPRAESRRTAAVHAGPLLRRPGILEPVHDVVRVQRFSAAARLQGVQLDDVVLYLLARRMLILGEPALKTR